MRSALVRSIPILGMLACAYEVVAPAEDARAPAGWTSAGSMSAATETDHLNSVFVRANRFDDVLIIEGETWLTGESTLSIRLTMRTDVGTSDQTIDSLNVVAADVMYRPWYTEPQGWSAYRSTGSGTFAFTSLTSNRATGRFTFSAPAVTANADPRVFNVLRGTFEVRF